MLILVVETDPALRGALELMLRSAGNSVHLADNGEDAIAMAKDFDFDAITLELALPDMTGFEALREIRAAKIKSAVIVVTGFADIDSKVKALGHGADDYLTKPFHRDELVARLHAIVRRSQGHVHSVITTGALVVDLDERTVSVAGRAVHLTGKEYQLVEILALRKGKCVTKDMLFQHLYSGMDEPEIKIVDVFICKLRKKFVEASGGLGFIETIWGRGYTLAEPGDVGGSKQKPPGLTRAMIAQERASANAAV